MAPRLLVRLGVVTFGLTVAISFVLSSGARTVKADARLLDFITPLVPGATGLKLVTGLFSDAAEGFADGVVKSFAHIIEYLFGGLLGTISTALIRFLVTIQLDFTGSLDKVVAPMYVIGAFFLLIGLIVSSMRAMAAVVSGTDTASRAFSGVALRICTLALVMAAWHTILPFTVKLANGLSAYVLDDQAVQTALQKSFFVTEAFGGAGAAACAGTGVGCVVTPIILLVLLLLVAVTIVTVLIMKYVLAFGFAVAFVGGPVALGAGGIPGVGEPALNMLLRSVCVFMIIPLVWCICFAAWVGVVASTIDTPSGAGDAVLQVVNGPGMFAAAMLVLLGVTRKLLQMAMPLGAPLGLPGPLRFLLAAAAMKFGGPIAQVAMDKVSGSGSTGQGPSLTEQEMVRAHNESSNSTATRALPMPAPRATSSETTADELAAVAGAGPPPTEDPDTLMPATASGWGPSNEALRGAAERVAGLRESGARLDIEGAWAGMSDDERASAAAAAEQAFRQPVAADQQAAYEQHMIRATAAGEFINPNAAAVLSTAHPSQIQALAADSAATTSVPESAPQPDVRTDAPTLAEHLRNGDWRQEDMIGGADMSALIPPAPPPAPPPPDGAP